MPSGCLSNSERRRSCSAAHSFRAAATKPGSSLISTALLLIAAELYPMLAQLETLPLLLLMVLAAQRSELRHGAPNLLQQRSRPVPLAPAFDVRPVELFALHADHGAPIVLVA